MVCQRDRIKLRKENFERFIIINIFNNVLNISIFDLKYLMILKLNEFLKYLCLFILRDMEQKQKKVLFISRKLY